MCTRSADRSRRKSLSFPAALILCAAPALTAGTPFGPDLPHTSRPSEAVQNPVEPREKAAVELKRPEPTQAETLEQNQPLKRESTPAHERIPLGKPAISEPLSVSSESPTQSLISLRSAGSLTLVLGLVFVLKFVLARASKSSGSFSSRLGAGGRAPSGVLEVIGRYPVARGITLVLLRLDRRVLLLSQSPEGFSTLAELTDPDDIASILTKTRDEDGDSISSKFASMLRRFESDHTIIEEPVHIPESPIATHRTAPLVSNADITTSEIQTHLARIRELQS